MSDLARTCHITQKSHGIEIKEKPQVNSRELAPTTQELATQNKTSANTQETAREESSEPVTRKPVIQQIRLSEECSISGSVEEHQDMAYFDKKREQERANSSKKNDQN